MTDGTSPRLDGRRVRKNRPRVDIRPAPLVPNPTNVRKPSTLDHALGLAPILPPPMPDPDRDLREALLACELAMDATTRAAGPARSTGPVWDAYDLLLQSHDKLTAALSERAAAVRAIGGAE